MVSFLAIIKMSKDLSSKSLFLRKRDLICLLNLFLLTAFPTFLLMTTAILEKLKSLEI